MTGDGYQDIKAGLLKVCGYTPKLAGEVFYGFKSDAMKGMSADQLYHRGTAVEEDGGPIENACRFRVCYFEAMDLGCGAQKG